MMLQSDVSDSITDECMGHEPAQTEHHYKNIKRLICWDSDSAQTSFNVKARGIKMLGQISNILLSQIANPSVESASLAKFTMLPDW